MTEQNIYFKDKTLYFDEKSISFDYQIRDVRFIQNFVVVLLAIPTEINSLFENILAFTLDGQFVWSVQPVKEKFPAIQEVMPYENMFYSDDKLSASDFYGRKYNINITDGKILEMKVFR